MVKNVDNILIFDGLSQELLSTIATNDLFIRHFLFKKIHNALLIDYFILKHNIKNRCQWRFCFKALFLILITTVKLPLMLSRSTLYNDYWQWSEWHILTIR